MVTDTKEDKHEPSQSQSVSLIKRLAGPSTTKAGLALDQTEINQIIAEASKGSKFYEANQIFWSNRHKGAHVCLTNISNRTRRRKTRNSLSK
jgi:hypothetical protein